MEEFKKHLKENNIEYKIVDGVCVITENNRDVWLPEVTTIPKNVKFQNSGNIFLPKTTTIHENVRFQNSGNIFLPKTTTIHENVEFQNGGDVSLPGVTTIPENVKFQNSGYVFLPKVTIIHENVEFQNGGRVSLPKVTIIHENVEFQNGGRVYMDSPNGKHIYQGKEYEFRNIDYSTMIVFSSTQKNDIKVMKCAYFGGGLVEKLKKCYIVQRGDFYAHGETESEAIEDLEYKHLVKGLNKDDVVKNIVKRGTVTVNDYRLLTGACRMGIKKFKQQHNITENELPLKKVLEIIEGEYGSEDFRGFFEN